MPLTDCFNYFQWIGKQSYQLGSEGRQRNVWSLKKKNQCEILVSDNGEWMD